MIGKTVSHYAILEKIGEGGMSTVYLAEDQKLQRKVALKFLQPRLTVEPVARERFLREARAAAALNHPNVVAVHEIGEHEDQVFIVLDYLEGQTLQQRIRAARGEGASADVYVGGDQTPTETPTESIHPMEVSAAGLEPPADAPLTTEEIVDIGRQVCRGLAAAHRAGIVHRDIKPQNIHIDEHGHVRILDFGLAKLRGAQALTMEFTTMGTVHYMSPEQAEGKDVDHRTDIWSLGVVLYQMASGSLPFRGETADTVIHSILHREPPPLQIADSRVPRELQRVLSRALDKKPDARFDTADALEQALLGVSEELVPPPAASSLLKVLARPRFVIPAVVALGVIGVLFGRWTQQRSRVGWANETAIPEIMRLVEQGDHIGAFSLALEAERFIPSHPVLVELWGQFSNTVDVRTEPSGATVLYREYGDVDGEWISIGQTPFEDVRLPAAVLRIRVEAAGYTTRELARLVPLPSFVEMVEKWGVAIQDDPVWKFDFTLDPEGSLPEGMIAVEGGTYITMPINGFPQYEPFTLDRYLIDATEVTNRQFKEFVDGGGYERAELWTHAFVRDGEELSFDEAMTAFRDSTDRPGPAHWVMGEFPEGLEDHPVEAVSWYEAAAFCEFKGKRLPTAYHWGAAAFPTWERNVPMLPLVIPLSNFQSDGTVPVGSTPGISVSGAHDMAGNVREWCWNASGDDRYSLGAAWSDAGKVATSGHHQSPWNRIPTNGFRCVQYTGGKPDEQLMASVHRPPPIDHDDVPGRSDDEWRTFADRYYRYFPAPMNASVDSTGDSPTGGREEWVSVDAPYGGQRLPIRLHLPVDVDPPYQAVVYFPGSDLLFLKTIRDYDKQLEHTLDFIVKSGRVLVQPIFDGTFERNDGRTEERWNSASESDELRGHWVMEVSRTLDYLEEREDIDGTKVAYSGFSLGASQVARNVLAVEDRFRAALIWMGGYYETSDMRYMIDARDCARRVKTPVLMVNGRYDLAFDLDTQQIPMFEALGVPDEHKRHVVYDIGHSLNFPRAEFIRENLAWLDRYLGPVERAEQ